MLVNPKCVNDKEHSDMDKNKDKNVTLTSYFEAEDFYSQLSLGEIQARYRKYIAELPIGKSDKEILRWYYFAESIMPHQYRVRNIYQETDNSCVEYLAKFLCSIVSDPMLIEAQYGGLEIQGYTVYPGRLVSMGYDSYELETVYDASDDMLVHCPSCGILAEKASMKPTQYTLDNVCINCQARDEAAYEADPKQSQ